MRLNCYAKWLETQISRGPILLYTKLFAFRFIIYYIRHMPLDESSSQTDTPWPDLDLSLLGDGRLPAVPFPLDVLPDKWRSWVERSAQVFAPVDYFAQGLLGAVAVACGGGIAVRVTPQWSEPLLLWQALVGAPSSGKTPALAAARRLVDGLDDEGDNHGDGEAEPGPETPADQAEAVRSQLLSLLQTRLELWQDDLAGILAPPGRNRRRTDWLVRWDGGQPDSGGNPSWGRRSPLNVLGGLALADVAEIFGDGDEGLAARFLYAWPEPPARPVLSDLAADDQGIQAMLRRIAGLACATARPGELGFEADAVARFEELLAVVRERGCSAEGWEAAWIGKAPGTIGRLAGLLTLMHWAQESKDEVPEKGVTVDQLEGAYALWADYFLPHAQRVFLGAGCGDRDHAARRTVRWLRRTGAERISRENIRRDAFRQAITADSADEIIARLEDGGCLRPIAKQSTGGRPRRRWDVNPCLR
jgi:hypothetical protein